MTDSTKTKDSLGRTLEVQSLDAVGMLDLYEAAGALCNNAAWLGTALIACSVRSIDGTPVPMPRDKAGIRSLVGKLQTPGINAAREALSNREEAEPSADEVKEAAKN